MLQPELEGRRVLVVDDDAMVRFILTCELEDAGCDVATADDGSAGLAAIKDDGPYDLLVTDIRMPGLDGWTLADRARELNPALPVLYVTGWSEEEARPVPGSTVLAKPFMPRDLIATAAALVTAEPRV